MYSDEVVPGNQLKHMNKRNQQVVHWSIKQFGAGVLCNENNWFVMVVLRSTIVREMDGGMSKLFGLLLKEFFNSATHHLRTGGMSLRLCTSDNIFVLFMRNGIKVADELALKSVWLCKGASGTKMCMCCMNVVAIASDLPALDMAFVPASEPDPSKFRLHTDATVKEIVQRLARDHNRLSATDFEALEKTLGWTHSTGNVLLDRDLELEVMPISQTMFDWMHCLVVNGTMNLELGLLMTRLGKHRLDGVKIDYSHLHAYMQGWTWPARVGNDARDIFNAKRARSSKAAGTWKASASEA